MNQRLTVALAALAVLSVSAVPSHAATKKKKPPPITVTYSVTAYPDVTAEVLGQVPNAKAGCGKLPQLGVNLHPITVPAAGTLHIELSSTDPTPAASPIHADWDLYLLDADGQEMDASTSSKPQEQVTDKFKKKQDVTIKACNLNGETTASVTYTFTYA